MRHGKRRVKTARVCELDNNNNKKGNLSYFKTIEPIIIYKQPVVTGKKSTESVKMLANDKV